LFLEFFNLALFPNQGQLLVLVLSVYGQREWASLIRQSSI